MRLELRDRDKVVINDKNSKHYMDKGTIIGIYEDEDDTSAIVKLDKNGEMININLSSTRVISNTHYGKSIKRRKSNNKKSIKRRKNNNKKSIKRRKSNNKKSIKRKNYDLIYSI